MMSEKVETTVELKPGETADQRMAQMMVGPDTRAAFLHYTLARKLFGPRGDGVDQRASLEGMITEIGKQQEAAGSGDLRRASDLLITQAHVLDAMFGDFMHRALETAGEYPDAMQRYMNLALKAQAQSRTAIEALARIHQPREQVVRHVHVYEGGQAVVAEQLHMHGPGVENAGIANQSYTARATGPGECTSLPSPKPIGDSMPIPSREGPEAVSHARRDEPRRSARQPKRPQARAANG